MDGLHNLLSLLFEARDDSLQAVYHETADNRRLQANGVYSTELGDLKAQWERESLLVQSNPELHDVSRDARCHDAVMWFVHHVPGARKAELVASGVLDAIPLMPKSQVPHTKGKYLGNSNPAAVEYVFNSYASSSSCAACHASGQTALNTESKEWPSQLSYDATGYGAFPFWDNTGAGCTYCDPSVDTPAALKVKYDSISNSELLMHESCGDMSWTGDDNAPNGTPCNHIFNSTYGAFIYTPATSLEPEADGEFCCQTFDAGDTNFPGAVPTDWMRSMNYWGNNTGFVGDYYSGEVKIYWSTIFGVDFWYYEDSDGNPVEQGEGCYFPGVNTKVACDYMLPIMLWHDYDPDTFLETPHTADEFAVPDVCMTTTVSCAAPGGSSSALQSYSPGPLTLAARMAGVH